MEKQIHVTIEVSKDDLDLKLSNSGQIILDKVRPKVDEMVASVRGARLLVERGSELRVSEGQHILTMEHVYLIAAAFWVWVPDGAFIPDEWQPRQLVRGRG